MRWALMGSFEHSNRELLALSICRDMTVFVVHKESHRGPEGSPGVPGACPGVPGASPGVAGVCPGDPRESRGLWGRPGHPLDPFHKDDSVI